MPVQVNIFILLFGALQGVFLSFVLLQKKVHRNGYSFLVLYILVMVLQVTLKVMSKIWLLDNMQSIYTLSYQFPLLYGPLIYLFTKNFLEKRPVGIPAYIHFIPFVLVLYYFLFGNYHDAPPVIVAPLFHPVWRLVIELICLLLYHSLAYQSWRKYQNRLKDFLSDIKQQQARWIRQFIIGSFSSCVLIAIVIYLMYTWYPFHQEIRFGFIVLTLFIYWISYAAWHRPQLFTFNINGIEKVRALNAIHGLIIRKPLKKYANSGLDKAQMNKIIVLLDQSMEKEKAFLDSEITIEKLAEAIHCSRHHLSQVLNEGLHKSFYDYINYYRVEEAKILLTDPKRAEHKIAAIAYDAGFNSLSTFNDVFKKAAGITPSQYRKVPAKQFLKQRV